MKATWTEIIKNNRGYWRLYYDSKKSWHYPYLVEFIGERNY